MQEIKDIKIMLLGIAVILFVIVLHLVMTEGLLTDLIALVGLIMVVVGYKKTNDEKKTDD